MESQSNKISAAVYDSSDAVGVTVTQVTKPTPSRNKCLIKVMACGINPVDAKYELGDKLPEGQRWVRLSRSIVNTHVVGFDFSGYVEQTFEGSKFNVGDEVFGLMPPMSGSFAEYITIRENALSLKP